MPETADVLIIGAGIIGASCAFRLGERAPRPGMIISAVYEVECRGDGRQVWPELYLRDLRPADPMVPPR